MDVNINLLNAVNALKEKEGFLITAVPEMLK
jgi:hypothetical protein